MFRVWVPEGAEVRCGGFGSRFKELGAYGLGFSGLVFWGWVPRDAEVR